MTVSPDVLYIDTKASLRYSSLSFNSDGVKNHQTSTTSSQKKKNVESPEKKRKVNIAKIKQEICDSIEFGWKLYPESLEITLPIRTISEANCQEHWTKRHRRHKKQKNTLFWSIIECIKFVKFPCTITFIRYAPKFLDAHDNLPMSMKWICDQVCAEITQDFRPGRADNFDGISIKYDQIKSKIYAVKIKIEF